MLRKVPLVRVVFWEAMMIAPATLGFYDWEDRWFDIC